jgi:hypothetical protein
VLPKAIPIAFFDDDAAAGRVRLIIPPNGVLMLMLFEIHHLSSLLAIGLRPGRNLSSSSEAGRLVLVTLIRLDQQHILGGPSSKTASIGTFHQGTATQVLTLDWVVDVWAVVETALRAQETMIMISTMCIIQFVTVSERLRCGFRWWCRFR